MLYLLCAAAVFAGSLLQTVTGLGLAILTMAVLPFFLPLSAALAISSFLGVGHSLCSLGKNFRLKVSTKIFVPVLTYFVVSAVMSRFMISLSSDVAIRILGVSRDHGCLPAVRNCGAGGEPADGHFICAG